MNIQTVGTVTAILAVLSGAASAQSVTRYAPQYPKAVISSGPDSVARGCTQLEMSAGVAAADCGSLELAEVVRRVTAPDDRGDANE